MRGRTSSVLGLILLFAAVFAVASPPSAASGAPHFTKVFVVVLENEDAQSAARQPFLARLAKAGALLADYSGVSHPSQPNYLAITSGSTWGIRNNSAHNLDATHIGDLLEAKGRSWKSYAEDCPGGCDLRATIGKYARKHEPFLSYLNVQQSAERCARVVNSAQFDADLASGALPDFSLYIPNNRNNGHDTGVAFADKWLARRFGPLLDDARFMKGMLFVVTFDEADHGNGVFTVLFGDMVQPGAVSDTAYDHYSLLRTIEDGFGLGSLGRNDAAATPITGVFK
jgi:phospholipase C